MEKTSSTLHGRNVVHAPMSSLDSKNSSEVPSHLTKNGIWNLNSLPVNTSQKDMGIVIQVTKVTMIEAEKPKESAGGKPKPQFRAKYILSDGIASIMAIVVEQSYNKFVSRFIQFCSVQILIFVLTFL